VQKSLAGKAFARADIAAVVSNGSYTRAAKELAGRNCVLLLHFIELQQIDALCSARR
jgi:HJR/Mrr/RecB family endonuclease